MGRRAGMSVKKIVAEYDNEDEGEEVKKKNDTRYTNYMDLIVEWNVVHELVAFVVGTEYVLVRLSYPFGFL